MKVSWSVFIYGFLGIGPTHPVMVGLDPTIANGTKSRNRAVGGPRVKPADDVSMGQCLGNEA